MKYLLHVGPGIGDFATILPMARRIKLFDRKAYITAFSRGTSKGVEVIKQMLPLQKWIDEIEYYSLEEPFHTIKFMFKLGIKKYDYATRIAYLDNKYVSNWPNIIMRLASKKSAGTNLKCRPDFNYDYAIDFSTQVNVYQQHFDLLSRLGISRCCNEEDYPCFDLEKLNFTGKILNLLSNKRNIIAIVPGAGNMAVTADGKNGSKPAKKWLYKNWFKLCDLLAGDGYYIVILGGKKEYDEIKDLRNVDATNIINLCGQTSIKESLSIVHNAQMVVGVDTGLLHCAAGIGTTSLTLCGCTSYKKYLPLSKTAHYIQSEAKCSPCFGTDRWIHCSDFHCMKKISVEDVYNKIISILGADSGN